MAEPTDNLSIFKNILFDPNKAFKAIQADYPIALPLILFLSLATFATFLYYALVDYDWFVEQSVEMLAGDKSKSEQNTIRSQMSLVSPMLQGILSAVILVFGSLILFVVYAGYYVLCSSINNDGYDFKQWFSFIVWSWIPNSFSVLISILIILLSDNGQVSQEALNPTSLNSLFYNLETTSGLRSLFSSIDIATFWTIGIMIVGYKTWTNCSLGKSITIVLLPYFVIFGGWALFAT